MCLSFCSRGGGVCLEGEGLPTGGLPTEGVGQIPSPGTRKEGGTNPTGMFSCEEYKRKCSVAANNKMPFLYLTKQMSTTSNSFKLFCFHPQFLDIKPMGKRHELSNAYFILLNKFFTRENRQTVYFKKFSTVMKMHRLGFV